MSRLNASPPSDLLVSRSIDQVGSLLEAHELARRCAKWLLVHRSVKARGAVHWMDLHGRWDDPPADIAVLLVDLERELSLDAESAG